MEKLLHARLGQAQVTENDFFEARELMRKAEQQGVETAMMFNYRFFEVSAKLREVLAGRDTGPCAKRRFMSIMPAGATALTFSSILAAM